MPGFFLFLFGGYDTVPYICGTKANNMNISEIKVGDKFQAFYGDGTPQGIITITRFTKAFVCVTLTNNRQHTFAEHKEGNTRVADYLKTGAWTPVKN